MSEQLPVFKKERLVKKRRRWSVDEKMAILREALATSVIKTGARHKISSRLIFHWRRQYRLGLMAKGKVG